MAIPPQNVPYKVKKGPERADVQRAEQIMLAFGNALKQRVKRMMVSGDLQPVPKAPTVDDLLDLRNALVRSVEVGMLERKDQEDIIGVLAALVWYCRQEEDRQHKIQQTWG